MSHVFISYKRDDGHFVDSLREKLKAAEIDSWVDTEIEAGEDWKEKIDWAIEKSFAVIVIITPESHKSPYVTYEWSFAMGLQIPVVPLLLRTVEMHPKLIALEHLNFVGRNAPYDLLIGRLKKLTITPPPINKVNQDSETIEEFKSLLDDLDSNRYAIREAAAITLGELRVKSSVSKLISLFQDPDSEVQIAAISAVAQIGLENAVPALVAVINRRDEKRSVQTEAHKALAQIGGNSAINYLCNRFSSRQQNDRTINCGFTLIDLITWNSDAAISADVFNSLKLFAKAQLEELLKEVLSLSRKIENLHSSQGWKILEKKDELSLLVDKFYILSRGANALGIAELANFQKIETAFSKCKSDLHYLDLDDIPF